MDFDWKKTLPFIGAMATGGVPALVIAAASAIGEALGKPIDATESGIAQAISGATPEQMVALKKLELDLKVKMREFDIEEKKIEAGTAAVYVEDVKSARQWNANTHGILILGYLINASSYFCVASILYGCFQLINGAKLNIDPAIAGTIGTVLGACLNWLMTNTNQSNGFFFGSSPSSRQSAAEMSRAVTEAASKVK